MGYKVSYLSVELLVEVWPLVHCVTLCQVVCKCLGCGDVILCQVAVGVTHSGHEAALAISCQPLELFPDGGAIPVVQLVTGFLPLFLLFSSHSFGHSAIQLVEEVLEYQGVWIPLEHLSKFLLSLTS